MRISVKKKSQAMRLANLKLITILSNVRVGDREREKQRVNESTHR